MSEIERATEIFHELYMLNQFIKKTDKSLLNILNGSEIVYSGKDYLTLRWELVDIRSSKTDVESKPKLNRLELHQAEKYLRVMKAQSAILDSTGHTNQNHITAYTLDNVK